MHELVHAWIQEVAPHLPPTHTHRLKAAFGLKGEPTSMYGVTEREAQVCVWGGRAGVWWWWWPDRPTSTAAFQVLASPSHTHPPTHTHHAPVPEPLLLHRTPTATTAP